MTSKLRTLRCNRTTKKPFRFSLVPNSTNAVDSAIEAKSCEHSTFRLDRVILNQAVTLAWIR